MPTYGSRLRNTMFDTISAFMLDFDKKVVVDIVAKEITAQRMAKENKKQYGGHGDDVDDVDDVDDLEDEDDWDDLFRMADDAFPGMARFAMSLVALQRAEALEERRHMDGGGFDMSKVTDIAKRAKGAVKAGAESAMGAAGRAKETIKNRASDVTKKTRSLFKKSDDAAAPPGNQANEAGNPPPASTGPTPQASTGPTPPGSDAQQAPNDNKPDKKGDKTGTQQSIDGVKEMASKHAKDLNWNVKAIIEDQFGDTVVDQAYSDVDAQKAVARVFMGMRKAVHQLQMLCYLYATFATIDYDGSSGSIVVRDPDGDADVPFMAAATHMMRQRLPPSYVWDAEKQLTRVLRAAIQAYNETAERQPPVMVVTDVIKSAAVKCVERFSVWFNKQDNFERLYAYLMADENILRYERNRMRAMCLQHARTHLYARASMYYFQRLAARIEKAVIGALGEDGALELLGCMLSIDVDGFNIVPHFTHGPLLDDAKLTLSFVLASCKRLQRAFDENGTMYRNSGIRLTSAIADAIVAAAPKYLPPKGDPAEEGLFAAIDRKVQEKLSLADRSFEPKKERTRGANEAMMNTNGTGRHL